MQHEGTIVLRITLQKLEPLRNFLKHFCNFSCDAVVLSCFRKGVIQPFDQRLAHPEEALCQVLHTKLTALDVVAAPLTYTATCSTTAKARASLNKKLVM